MNPVPAERKSRLRRVLLIDDDGTDNFLHSRVLNKSGRVEEIVAFEHAEQALEYLRGEQHPVDLIFLDINMPRMNGFDFLAAFEPLIQELSLPTSVVLLSTSINPADVQRASQFSTFLLAVNKPLRLKTLHAAIDRHISSRQGPNHD